MEYSRQVWYADRRVELDFDDNTSIVQGVSDLGVVWFKSMQSFHTAARFAIMRSMKNVPALVGARLVGPRGHLLAAEPRAAAAPSGVVNMVEAAPTMF